MKRLYYSLFAVLSVCIVVIAMAFVKAKNEPDKHLEIVLRSIGNQLLLHSGDSTSLVLPVEKVNENTYQISFEKNFTFAPDTLMKLVRQELLKTSMPTNYIVNVKDCSGNKTVFGYEINSSDGDLKPCRGRIQKTGCYIVEIAFLSKSGFNFSWLWLAIIPIALAGFYFYHRANKRSSRNLKDDHIEESAPDKDAPAPLVSGYKTLGQFVFNEANGTLSLDDLTIELSDKEAKALSIFAANQNLVVGRELLMKELWEDEGVVVISRNVDVLISKLRKKLSADPGIRILNVHGKGYRMTIDNA